MREGPVIRRGTERGGISSEQSWLSSVLSLAPLRAFLQALSFIHSSVRSSSSSSQLRSTLVSRNLSLLCSHLHSLFLHSRFASITLALSTKDCLLRHASEAFYESSLVGSGELLDGSEAQRGGEAVAASLQLG